jgi:hypothetical protein
MTDRTFIFQTEGGGEEKSITINTSKTVKDLINTYLEGKNLQNSDNVFAFMVGANPLNKEKFINAQIKNLRFLKPNAIIKVREVDTKAGGRF